MDLLGHCECEQLHERVASLMLDEPSKTQGLYAAVDELQRELESVRQQHRGAVASLAVIRGALDDLEHAPHRAQALADLPDIIRAALGGQ